MLAGHAGLSSIAGVHFDLPTSGAYHHAHLHLLRGAREHAAAGFAWLWRLHCALTALHNCECVVFTCSQFNRGANLASRCGTPRLSAGYQAPGPFAYFLLWPWTLDASVKLYLHSAAELAFRRVGRCRNVWPWRCGSVRGRVRPRCRCRNCGWNRARRARGRPFVHGSDLHSGLPHSRPHLEFVKRWFSALQTWTGNAGPIFD